MLVTDRRRSFGMREEQNEQDPWQGSLFAPDSLSPPRRPPDSTPDPFAGASSAPTRHAPGDAVARPPTDSRAGVSPADVEGDASTAFPEAVPHASPPSRPASSPPPAAEPGEAVAPGARVAQLDDAVPLAGPRVSQSEDAVLLAGPPVAQPDDATAPADYSDDLTELEPAHARPVPSRSLLAGPTLDDIMSGAWEGLRAEVPTPCPVCHAEIEPSAGGRCGACGSTLD